MCITKGCSWYIKIFKIKINFKKLKKLFIKKFKLHLYKIIVCNNNNKKKIKLLLLLFNISTKNQKLFSIRFNLILKYLKNKNNSNSNKLLL